MYIVKLYKQWTLNKHQWSVAIFSSSVEIFSLCKCSVISSPVVPLPDSLKCFEFPEMANGEILVLNLSLSDHWSYWNFGLSEVHSLTHCSRIVVSVFFRIIGTSKVRALPLEVEADCSVHYFWNYFVHSKVKVLPLGIAAECSIHYFCNYFSTFLGFWDFAGVLSHTQKKREQIGWPTSSLLRWFFF